MFHRRDPKFAAQAVRKAYDIGWKPMHYITNVSISVASVLRPAGLDNSGGLVTADSARTPATPAGRTSGIKEWRPSWTKYITRDLNDGNNAYGYRCAATLVQVLKQCEDDLSRENIMKQAASLKDLEMPMLLPGIKINTRPTISPDQADAAKTFDGKSWELFGELIAG